jgi:hypothetical protein
VIDVEHKFGHDLLRIGKHLDGIEREINMFWKALRHAMNAFDDANFVKTDKWNTCINMDVETILNGISPVG